MKKFTSTKAKLPKNEMVIGGDAPKNCYNKAAKKKIKKVIRKIRKEGGK